MGLKTIIINNDNNNIIIIIIIIIMCYLVNLEYDLLLAHPADF